ncbi:GNAT family N-acetyltransferase [Bacillus sp. S/N-304-OC-R1]|uniref:GNAT family N-acetyltransferase n=1 Tax=Bacillus sp. S/N-304-OC-R1 TaxID=2758034 RepID=UPI001C8E2B2D|nr:GNAT family protein [Bacillus sp. S/N-304-OC-R1]MBY0122784.1 GNAT family N-acetyltransferase [Bacillus sp. S/N-304-OC-R1]
MEQKTIRPARFLEGKRLYLKPISLEDSRDYYEKLFNLESRRLTGLQRSYTKEQIDKYLEGKVHETSSLLYLIALKESDEVVGDIALQDIDSFNRSANIRIAIDNSSHQGKGYGSEAMLLLLDYGFGIVNLHRIELNVFSYNERAKHVYEKLGFKVEGVQRDALYYNHSYHDSILMSLLEHEYREKYVK